MKTTFRCLKCKSEITFFGSLSPSQWECNCGGEGENIDDFISKQDEIKRLKDLEKYF